MRPPIERIAVVGLGYVGLPVALGFARHFDDVVGFDESATRVAAIAAGEDVNGEVAPDELATTRLRVTSDPAALRGCTFFVVAVPTPVDKDHAPRLDDLVRASETVGRALSPGGVVVYESTVYPGATREVCAPALARTSGLARADFHLGYSPERINPGDGEHTLERVVKVVAGEDAATLERVAAAYARVVDAGVHRAPSIEVAEAAKVIENTQRDLNIALMNELAVLFERMGLRTRDVLDAAGTKWNFLRFEPGLVGGHCIGVDPYYLTKKAQDLGYQPEVILAGRRVNDQMPAFVAQRLVKMLLRAGRRLESARVGVLGLTFKEDVRDLRNSKVPGIVDELRQFSIDPLVHDPLASPADARREHGLELRPLDAFHQLDGLVVAVAHRTYRELGSAALYRMVSPGGVVADVKSLLDPREAPPGLHLWSL